MASEFHENFSNPVAWDSLIAAHGGPDGGLLQSWLWGEVQRAAGRSVQRAAFVDGSGQLAAGWQIVVHQLPLGQRYWYVPRPVENFKFPISNFKFFLPEIIKLSKREKAVFIRVDAGEHAPPAELGFRLVAGSVQPPEELHVDLRRPAAERIAAMKPKARYNIGLSRRHGVVVEERPLAAAGSLTTLTALVQETASRHDIQPHPPAYYRAMLTALAASGAGRLLVASSHGEPLAVALLVACNGVLTYLHGGSSTRHAEVMAPYLLHWEAMELGERLGCRTYNFGGVSARRSSWAGLTRFKQGFAPNTPFVQYGGLWELVLRPRLYLAYQIVRKLR